LARLPADFARTAVRPRPWDPAVWVREVRLPFMTAAVVPVFLGAAVALYDTGRFSPTLFILTLLGAVLAHAGANMANDYWDSRSGNDDINRWRSPFNGGTGLIQEGVLRPRHVHLAALTALGAAAAVGFYLSTVKGTAVLVLTLVGGVSAYFYTADPFHLAYHGLGEIMVGASFGPLLVAGADLVQAGSVSARAVAAAVPVGMLIAAVLYINQFPDYEADRAVGKAHWVVRLGTRRALPGLAGLLVGAYLAVGAGVAAGLLPWPTLAAVLTAPLSAKALSVAWRHHDQPVQLRPANALVIQTHLLTGLLLVAGFLAAALAGV